MRVENFFTETEVPETDPWSPNIVIGTRFVQNFNHDMVSKLRQAPHPERPDLEVALALCQLIHEDLEAFGTGGGQMLSEDNVAMAIRALTAVTRRLGLVLELPYRGFSSFKSYWLRNGGHGSWQARREMLAEVFDPLHLRLQRLEDATFEALIDPISPRAEVGWPAVDEEIRELRRRFETATSAQDHRDVGLRCVTVTELLGDAVYQPMTHDIPGESPAPRGSTKDRFERYIRHVLRGKDNAAARSLARAVIVFAQDVKHSTTPTRRQAGIAADSVIMLANLLRRLDQQI